MKKTNFDQYLEQQLRDPEFATRFESAGKDWDIALQISAWPNPATPVALGHKT